MRAIRQYLKMIVQNCILPIAYRIFSIKRIRPGLVVMADGHSLKRPIRMDRMYEALVNNGYEVVEWYNDFQAVSYVKALVKMIGFMKLYARANYVVISDNFLPAASCKKRKGTFVIQMWHGCGAFKKFGYDTTDDIPADYIGNVFKNYDLVTVSGPLSVEPFSSAMKLEKGVCRPIGVSATDVYYDDDYTDTCRREFFERYPEAVGKKILLWAPTFRGSAISPYVPDSEVFESLQDKLNGEWFVVIKYHPHMENKGALSSTDISTERLLPVADLLITDYSSIIFNYSIYRKPILLYAPDYKAYKDSRGFYLEYESIPAEIAVNEDELVTGIGRAYEVFDKERMERFYQDYMSGCDGKATERILKVMKKRYAK